MGRPISDLEAQLRRNWREHEEFRRRLRDLERRNQASAAVLQTAGWTTVPIPAGSTTSQTTGAAAVSVNLQPGTYLLYGVAEVST